MARRSGPQRHRTADIADAIMKNMSGIPLAQIAKEKNVDKSLVKYWVDHADKFLPSDFQAKRAPVITKLLKKGELTGWKKFVQLISLTKKDINEMDGMRRIEAAEKLKDILLAIANKTGDGTAMPDNVVEVMESSSRLIVKNWMKKSSEGGLGGPPPQSSTETKPAGEVIDVKAQEGA